jgi:hypothetical protein
VLPKQREPLDGAVELRRVATRAREPQQSLVERDEALVSRHDA